MYIDLNRKFSMTFSFRTEKTSVTNERIKIFFELDNVKNMACLWIQSVTLFLRILIKFFLLRN